MSLPVAMSIAITEASGVVKAEDSLEDRLRAAMRKTYRHWMVTDEDEQVRSAVGAVLLSASEEEKDRLTAELRTLQSLSALFSGVPVDLERVLEQKEAAEEPVGIIRLWQEIKATA